MIKETQETREISGDKGDPGTTDFNDLENKPTKLSDFTNDTGFITKGVSDLTNYYNTAQEDVLLSGKQDKVEGKGLSTNDFTDTYKNNVDSNISARHTHSNKSVLDNISSTDVSNWDNKYDKPNGGIPKTDLSSAVQTSLGKADTAIQSHQDISGKEDKTNKSDSYTISSSETYASTKALVDGLATKKNIETKTITENDIRWHNGWKDCYNGTQLNLDVSGTGRMSMTPLWIIKGTTLNVNTSFYTQANTASGTKAYVDIELYKPSDGSANAYGWVNKVRKYMDIQGNYTIDETGYYIISVFNCTASNNPLKDYGKPYTFSYTVEGDFEVNYVNTVDWKIKDIVFVLNDNTQPSFSNGLNWACRREIGQPYYLANSGSASEHDMGCYSYNTNDFSGTRSSVSRQAVFVYKDEIWYFSPSLDGHVGIASLSKFKIYDNNWIEYIGHCWHNLGHMNSVGYEKSTDVFIWGNGSSSYSQEGEGYIINNFSNSKLATSYNDEIVLMSDMDVDVGSFAKATYGFKVNVIPFSVSCNNNSAPYNLYVAMVTNDGNTFRIGKITANSSGKYLWTNCVWENAKNIGDVSETQTESYEHCVQGMAVLNGHIIMGEGHTKPQIATIWNDTSTTLRTSCLLQQFLDSSITAVAVFDNKLVYCSSYEWIFTDITSLNNGISENKINELIENAIGNAIGGSY